jgi:hypothetical protein
MVKTSSAVCLAILLLICYLAMQLSLWITWLLLLRLGFFPGTLRHLLDHYLLGITVLRIGFKVAAGCLLLLSMQEMMTLAFSSIGDRSSILAYHPAAVRNTAILPDLASGQQLLPPRLSKICMLLTWLCRRHGSLTKVTQPTHQPTNHPS